jgi:hypothetical protein
MRCGWITVVLVATSALIAVDDVKTQNSPTVPLPHNP